MIYYAVAMTISLLLANSFSTAYGLPGGQRVSVFRSAGATFLVLLPLTFVAVMRWDVGADSLYQESYWEAFQGAKEGVNNWEFEIGFYWFLRLLALLGSNYYWFLFSHGVLFAALISIAFAKGSVWPVWSVLVYFLLYFYFDSYSSLRQSLAEAMSLIAWAEMLYSRPSGKRDLRILLIFGVASMFHMTALMNIPLYIVCKIRFSRGTLLKMATLAVILTPVFQTVLPILMRLLSPDQYEPIGFARINAAMSFVVFALCWYFYDEISALDENAYTFANLSLYVFIIFMNSNVLLLPFRIFDMAKISYVFIIPILLRGIRRQDVRVYMQYFLLAVTGAWFANVFFSETDFARDYQWVLEDWHYYTNLP